MLEPDLLRGLVGPRGVFRRLRPFPRAPLDIGEAAANHCACWLVAASGSLREDALEQRPRLVEPALVEESKRENPLRVRVAWQLVARLLERERALEQTGSGLAGPDLHECQG
jgi:hypothetical protein